MDTFEVLKVVEDRILKLEPEHIAKKVIGYLFLHYQHDEIISFAFGPDILIQNLILKAKVALQLSSAAIVSPPISPSVNPISISDPSLQYACFQSALPQCRSLPPLLAGARHWEYRQTEPMGLEDQFEPVDSVASGSDYFCNEGGVNNISLRHNQNMRSAPESPVKTCHYFNKGFCKHGSKCLFFHGQSPPGKYSHIFDLNAKGFGYEDQVFTPGSLERLEMEITYLLKSRGGSPLSIASLPLLYFERYGRTLQGEGYPGIRLAKLLARLNTTLKLVYRSDGQHAIMLAEDPSKNLEVQAETDDPGPVVSGSRQVYITFKDESTFTEEDVSNYFSTFGPVQDVRIPCRQERMFGFVTFASSDTVTTVLAKGNPHYVCEARVFVKPYKEKLKTSERTYYEKPDSLIYSSHHMNINFEHQSRLLRDQLIEEQKKALEIKMGRLSNLNLSQRHQSPKGHHSYFDRSIQELRVSQDHSKFPSAEQFSSTLNGGNTTDSHHAEINYTDPDRSHNLALGI
ncbi:hypothetical protein Leryth_013759 [Lithospermum erythrorhizon]|nr:hypothetical protein Leryth_013759 [Lithospermum erythrorhizon]